MAADTLLVLASPGEPQLALLRQLPQDTNVAVGDSVDAFRSASRNATIILNWSGSSALLREAFQMCPKLQWVHTRSAGLDSVLFQELVESPVSLTNGTGVFSPSLAEFVIAAILYFAKDFRRMIRNQYAGLWEAFDVQPVSGSTVGIVGYGDIGRAVAKATRAMGMRVLAMKRHSPLPSQPADPLVEQIYSPNGKIEMLSRCDYVVVSAPLTSETRGMIGKSEFAAMKSTAVIVNVGRGPIIDEAAMINALFEGRIKGAALDVFDQEPLPDRHPFYKLENVLLSPHCADHTPDWLDQSMQFFLTQFERFRKGEPLVNLANKKLGY
jgi:phosphoglycerate dehydrogenase-like enzyme